MKLKDFLIKLEHLVLDPVFEHHWRNQLFLFATIETFLQLNMSKREITEFLPFPPCSLISLLDDHVYL